MPRVLDAIEGHHAPLRQMGAERNVSGGVVDQSTHEEEGPVTWEALSSTPAGLVESR
jgi:hypothetical protein